VKNLAPAVAGSFNKRILKCGLPSSDLRYTSGPAASIASASCTRLRANTTASSAALAAAWWLLLPLLLLPLLLLLLLPSASPAPAAEVAGLQTQRSTAVLAQLHS
jgi:hypothetical protein